MTLNLWALYSFTYDSLKILPSYREMVSKVIDQLEIKNRGKYLDLGCGTGNLVIEIIKKYTPYEIKVYGLDFSKNSLLIANKKIRHSQVNSKPYFFFHDVRKGIPFPSEYFEGISLVQLINYLDVPNVVKLMKEVDRVTKKDGNIVIVSVAKEHKFMKGSSDFKEALKAYPLKAIKNVPFLIATHFFNLPMKLRKNMNLYDEKFLDKLGKTLGWKKEHSENLYYNEINLLVKFKKK